MAIYEIERGGKKYNVEAPDMQSALDGLAQQLGSATASAATEERPGGMQIVNEGLARGLGAPVDLVTAGLNAVTSGINTVTGSDFGHITDPVLGSNSIRGALQGTGNTVAAATGRDTEEFPVDMFAGEAFEPEGVVESFLLGTGSAAGGVMPMVGAGKALQTTTAPAARAIGDLLAKPYAAAPIRSAASEVAAGGGAAVGMDVADQIAPDSGLAQVIGAVGGGVAVGAGPSIAANVASRTPGLGTVARVVANEVAPFTKAGAMERARRRMMGLAEDPEAAIAGLRTSSISEMSPARSTGDRRLMALEHRARDDDPAIDMRMREQEARGSANLREALVDPARPVDSVTGERAAPLDGAPARQFVEGEIGREVDGVSQALDNTFGAPVPNATAVGNLQRSTQPARSAAYDQAYDAPVNLYATESGRQLETLLGRVQAAAPDALRKANRLMAGAGYESNQMLLQEAADGSVTLTNLPDTRQWDFITRALRDTASSTEGSSAFGGKNTYGSTLSALSREIRDIVRTANPAYGNALETAATALGQRDALRFGSDMLSPTIPRDIVAAEIADMTPAELNFARQAVRAQLDEQLANVRSTLSNPDTGLREAQSTLQRMSSRAVRDKIGELFPADQAQGFFQRMDEATIALDPRRSGLSVYAGARSGEEMRAVFSAPNPAQAARQLVAAAASDTTGQAMPSLKGSFIDEIMTRSRSGSFDDAGEAVLSGRAMRNALGDRRVAPVADAILSQEERGRLSQIVDELSTAEVAAGRLPQVGELMEGEPNSMVSLVARTFAARVGAHAGKGTSGASLLTASWASKRMQAALSALTLDRAEELIKQAITGDRDLFEALLTPGVQMKPEQEELILWALSPDRAITALRGASSAAIGDAGLGSVDDVDQEPQDPFMDAIMRDVPLSRAPVASPPSRSDFDDYIQHMMTQRQPRQNGPNYSREFEDILAAMM